MAPLWLAFVGCGLVIALGALTESKETVLGGLTLLCLVAAALSILEVVVRA